MKPKRILVVDDDTDDQELFCEALEQISINVECVIAENGLEALQHLEHPPPYDLIFLDLNMPVMNGYETLTVLKKDTKYRNIPVIIFSTTHNQNDIKKCMELGAEHFFPKPNNFIESFIRKCNNNGWQINKQQING